MSLYTGTNNASSTLAGNIDDAVTSLAVATGDGSKFPSSFPFPITIDSEIMLCTNRSTDTLTVTRGQEGTSAASHSAGTTVQNRITYGYFSSIAAEFSNYLSLSGGALTGALSFENNANFKLFNDSGVHKLLFDTSDYLGYDTANNVLYGYVGGVKSLQIGGGAVNYCNFAGLNAGSSNSGIRSNGFGYYSLLYNTGSYSNGFGHVSLQNNSGIHSNGFGYSSLKNNSGDYSNGFGYYSLLYNTGSYSNGFGHVSLQNNSGIHSNGFGNYSLQYNEGAYNTAIGSNTFNTFNEDSANAQNISSVDFANNRVTITAHGWGVADDTKILKASTTGTLPAGLSTDPHLWKVVDADTLECVTDSFTDVGTGTHTLTPQFIYTNSTAIGYNAEPDASNQVVLGDANVTEVKSAGIGNFGGLLVGTTDNTTEGALKWDSVNHKLLIHNGTAWETVTST